MGLGARVGYTWRRVFRRYQRDHRKKPGARPERVISGALFKKWALLLIVFIGVGAIVVCEFIVLLIAVGVVFVMWVLWVY